MDICCSACSSRSAESPLSSAPTQMATGVVDLLARICWVHRMKRDGVNVMRLTPAKEGVSLVSMTGTKKRLPMLARMILGLVISVWLSIKISASAPVASMVRRSVPILPGFSTFSATKRSGFLDGVKLDRVKLGMCATPSRPSACAR